MSYYAIIIAFCIACTDQTPGENLSKNAKQVEITEAKGFQIYTVDGGYNLIVKHLGDEFEIARYELRRTPAKGQIKIPVESWVSTSTTQLPFFTALNEEDKIRGHSGTDYVMNQKVRKLIEAEEIVDISGEAEADPEKVIALNVEAIMVYPWKDMNYDVIRKSGVAVIYNAEYLEPSPLARAEWIKFAAVFFDKLEKAERVFSVIEESYNNLKVEVGKVANKPKIFTGTNVQGTWYAPGAQSFTAAFIEDAGADYIFSDYDQKENIELDLEVVLERVQEADYWGKLVYDSLSYRSILNEDERYKNIPAFREKKVFYCNTSTSDYFGDAVLEPHIILSDLIQIFHPQLNLGVQQRYFYLLEE